MAVDSDGGNGMHGRYNSCSIGGRGFQGQAEMTDEDCAIGRWEQWAGFFDGTATAATDSILLQKTFVKGICPCPLVVWVWHAMTFIFECPGM